MARARRAAALLGLSLLLGGLAASDVSRRESALDRRLGPVVGRVVAARDLKAGRELRPRDLALRRIPARYAPVDALAAPAELAGQRLAVTVPRGGFIGVSHLQQAGAGAPVGPGERAAEVVGLGSPDWVVAGARVDVLVTRERGDGGPGGAELALEDVEVLAAAPAEDSAENHGADRVAATLRVAVREAVYLAAAQSFASEVRLLPRAAGDRRRTGSVRYGPALR